jgi:acyl-CoA reductase-like NAD-dependent aldehyde dehydrogenase
MTQTTAWQPESVTSDIDRALRFAGDIQAGYVMINEYFTGGPGLPNRFFLAFDEGITDFLSNGSWISTRRVEYALT